MRALTAGEQAKVYKLCSLNTDCSCEGRSTFCQSLVKYLEQAAWDVALASYIIQEDQLNKPLSEE